MRAAAALVLLGVLAAGCSGSPAADTPSDKPSGTASARAGTAAGTGAASMVPGCGLVQRSKVVGLLGQDVEVRAAGTLAALRRQFTRVSCSTAVPGHPERYVRVVADHHPQPFRLPTRSCSQGWVYAGTPDKYTPACQDTVGGHGRTQLFVRWQPYLMHVTIGRSDRNWGGDPEVALAMSRTLAQRLGVREAQGDG